MIYMKNCCTFLYHIASCGWSLHVKWNEISHLSKHYAVEQFTHSTRLLLVCTSTHLITSLHYAMMWETSTIIAAVRNTTVIQWLDAASLADLIHFIQKLAESDPHMSFLYSLLRTVQTYPTTLQSQDRSQYNYPFNHSCSPPNGTVHSHN